ncbi:hypothetical protein GGTG_11320 [Gaeumannomyces tritici R3-111a-1]|uniref:Uncharacterized protein n=1 Tax=Gaeumannomyces tritici (strain R3-111a-1) TaxID=644352 RepID=J3PCV1_GAET3|nr:hypothetical protein GGTG_11320 [Gaeumannomyces tritici R3-111a-1]EJT72072.1 hypothetical protein GGTG_11320 [Gaeumannomyces tritici R3-111a-1]
MKSQEQAGQALARNTTVGIVTAMAEGVGKWSWWRAGAGTGTGMDMLAGPDGSRTRLCGSMSRKLEVEATGPSHSGHSAQARKGVITSRMAPHVLCKHPLHDCTSGA